jgi:hypothetical protein
MATRFERNQEELIRQQRNLNRSLDGIRYGQMVAELVEQDRAASLRTLKDFERRLGEIPAHSATQMYLDLAELQAEWRATGITVESVRQLDAMDRIEAFAGRLGRLTAAAYQRLTPADIAAVEQCLAYEEELPELEAAVADRRARERLDELEQRLAPLEKHRPAWLSYLLVFVGIVGAGAAVVGFQNQEYTVGPVGILAAISALVIWLFTAATTQPAGLPLVEERGRLQQHLLHGDDLRSIEELYGTQNAAQLAALLAQRRAHISRVRG